jgi:uncharacterized protein YeaO (DUF488 family)
MAIRIVQLGSRRIRGEGLRIGTVRRPPRGVPRNRYAAENWFDVWLPNLAPSQKLMKRFRSSSFADSWKSFVRSFRMEMNQPESSRVLDVLAALSHSVNFSIGCYCDDEKKCHRSVLRTALEERDAALK